MLFLMMFLFALQKLTLARKKKQTPLFRGLNSASCMKEHITNTRVRKLLLTCETIAQNNHVWSAKAFTLNTTWGEGKNTMFYLRYFRILIGIFLHLFFYIVDITEGVWDESVWKKNKVCVLRHNSLKPCSILNYLT